MQFAGTIYEAATRIEEATAVYRFKARQIASEYDDVTRRWGDSRARQFDQLHLQSQREAMEEGERLCRQLNDLCDTAKRSAGEAERVNSVLISRCNPSSRPRRPKSATASTPVTSLRRGSTVRPACCPRRFALSMALWRRRRRILAGSQSRRTTGRRRSFVRRP